MASSIEVVGCIQLNKPPLTLSFPFPFQAWRRSYGGCQKFVKNAKSVFSAHLYILGYCRNMVVNLGLHELRATHSVERKVFFCVGLHNISKLYHHRNINIHNKCIAKDYLNCNKRHTIKCCMSIYLAIQILLMQMDNISQLKFHITSI